MYYQNRKSFRDWLKEFTDKNQYSCIGKYNIWNNCLYANDYNWLSLILDKFRKIGKEGLKICKLDSPWDEFNFSLSEMSFAERLEEEVEKNKHLCQGGYLLIHKTLLSNDLDWLSLIGDSMAMGGTISSAGRLGGNKWSLKFQDDTSYDRWR